MDSSLEVSQWLGPLLASCARTMGGWWTQQSITDVLNRYTLNDDTYYRAHFAYLARSMETRGARTFAEARPAYVIGHLAGIDPRLDEREWAEIEPVLARAWDESLGEWTTVSRYAHAAFRRSASAEHRGTRARQAQADTLPLERSA